MRAFPAFALRLSPLALVASGLLAACGDGESRRPSVVVIVLDTVRPDYLSVYGHPRPTTPFLESFAARGTLFERAYSTSSWTLPSHGSLFTGALPKTHRAHQTDLLVASSLPTLAERLEEVGYQTAGFSNNVWVSRLTGLDRGFGHFRSFVPGFGQRMTALAADPEGRATPPDRNDTVAAVLSWLREERDAERPFFLFVNMVEPHLPYLPSWEAVRHFVATKEDRFGAIQHLYPLGKPSGLLLRHYGRKQPLTEQEWAALRSLYEGELRVADGLVQAIVSGLDEAVDPEDTLVFVLSDHGENLGEHGHFTHIFNVFDSNLRIPLIARGPGFPEGVRRGDPVQILDLYPTILAAVGLRSGEHAVGADIRQPVPEDRVVLASLEFPKVSLTKLFGDRPDLLPAVAPYMRELRAAVGSGYKVIRGSDGEELVFDLRADPEEQHPLDPAVVDPAILARLRGHLNDSMGSPAPSTGTRREETEEDLQAIQDMGYAGGE